MSNLRVFILLLLTAVLSLNMAIASERAPVSEPIVSTHMKQARDHTQHVDMQTADRIECENHCASQTLASNHCGACLAGLAFSSPFILLSATSAILVATPSIKLQSISLPPPLHPPLQHI